MANIRRYHLLSQELSRIGASYKPRMLPTLPQVDHKPVTRPLLPLCVQLPITEIRLGRSTLYTRPMPIKMSVKSTSAFS